LTYMVTKKDFIFRALLSSAICRCRDSFRLKWEFLRNFRKSNVNRKRHETCQNLQTVGEFMQTRRVLRNDRAQAHHWIEGTRGTSLFASCYPFFRPQMWASGEERKP